MDFFLVFKLNDIFVKERYDFSTNPVYFQRFDVTNNENKLIKDTMIYEEEAKEHILSKLKDKDVLFYSKIDNDINYYHDFENFFKMLF